ncbi:MAG: protein-disulfide isomerase [Zetaproteobacteria bacterium CG_4_9_14_3_um_filter_53_7]|nr:MAG: protein-disulfide isomerase [Zetaproteobacteria bacterium CG_4_9_14_3_um_filter_53_7]
MRFFLLIITMLFASQAMATPGAEADKATTDRIKKAIPSLSIDTVRKSPINGLYELQVDRNIFYSDKNGEHLISGGHIFEIESRRDLTRERLEEINRIDWSTLPVDKAIVSGDKNATLKLAVFTDPDCPYCKKLEEELKNLTGVKVYTFLYPLVQLHPQSRAKSEAIWCSKDQHAMMLKVMLEKFVPEKATCVAPIDEIAAIAQKLSINGTPTMIAGDGRIASGGKDAASLKAWLENK